MFRVRFFSRFYLVKVVLSRFLYFTRKIFLDYD